MENKVRELYEQGIARELWHNLSECSRFLKVDRASLRKFVKGWKPTSPQGRSYFHRLLMKFNEALGQPEADEGGTGPPPVFTLTAESFRPVDAVITAEQRADTLELIRELCRRFELMAQLKDTASRRCCYQEFRRDLTELWLTAKLLQEMFPQKVMEEIETLRRKLEINS